MKINFIGPYSCLGYGVFGKNILRELDLVCEVSYHPIGHPQPLSDSEILLLNKTTSVAAYYNPNCPSLRLWHQHDLALHAGSPRIGWPIFELNRFTSRERHHLESQDMVFVCSQWAKNIILSETNQKNVSVIPGGVDTSIFYPTSTCASNKFIFLTIGKFEVRKNHEGIIRAFDLAFSDNDNVELWLMTENPFLDTQDQLIWSSLIEGTRLHYKIRRIPHFNTQHDIAKIINMASCGIFPSHAEGWDLPVLEMMACGKPVIVSNYSAHTEYCNVNNSILLNVNKLESANAVNYNISTSFDKQHFYGQGEWGQINLDDIVDSMRLAYKLGISINQEGIKTAQQFSWKNSVNKILETI